MAQIHQSNDSIPGKISFPGQSRAKLRLFEAFRLRFGRSEEMALKNFNHVRFLSSIFIARHELENLDRQMHASRLFLSPPSLSPFSLFIVFNTSYSYLLFFFLLFFFFFFFFFFLFLVNREDTLKRFKGMSDFLVGQERRFIDDDLNFKPKTNMLMGRDSFFGRHFFSGSRGTVSIQTGFWTMNMYLESFLLFPRRLCWVSIDVENILAQSNSDFSARDWKMVFLPLKNFSFADFWHFRRW